MGRRPEPRQPARRHARHGPVGAGERPVRAVLREPGLCPHAREPPDGPLQPPHGHAVGHVRAGDDARGGGDARRGVPGCRLRDRPVREVAQREPLPLRPDGPGVRDVRRVLGRPLEQLRRRPARGEWARDRDGGVHHRRPHRLGAGLRGAPPGPAVLRVRPLQRPPQPVPGPRSLLRPVQRARARRPHGRRLRDGRERGRQPRPDPRPPRRARPPRAHDRRVSDRQRTQRRALQRRHARDQGERPRGGEPRAPVRSVARPRRGRADRPRARRAHRPPPDPRGPRRRAAPLGAPPRRREPRPRPRRGRRRTGRADPLHPPLAGGRPRTVPRRRPHRPLASGERGGAAGPCSTC